MDNIILYKMGGFVPIWEVLKQTLPFFLYIYCYTIYNIYTLLWSYYII